MIFYAILGGQIVFALLSYLITLSTTISTDFSFDNDMFTLIVPVVVAISLAAGNMVFKQLLNNIRSGSGRSYPPYMSATIIRMALTEAPTLVALVAYIQSGNFLYFIVALFCIVIFISLRPTENRIKNDLQSAYERFKD